MATSPEIQDEPSVKYTVRDMFARVDGKLDSLTTLVAGKADKTDIDRLERRLDNHDNRLVTLETKDHDREVSAAVHEKRDEREEEERSARWSIRERILLAAASVAIAVGTLLAVLHP